MNRPATAFLLLSFAVVGCKYVAPDAGQPAVIVEPDAASRAALQHAVDTELGVEVLLADDALTGTSILIIEPTVPRSIAGAPAAGRTMEPPVRFELVTDGRVCVLVDTRDASRQVLADTRCVAAGQ